MLMLIGLGDAVRTLPPVDGSSPPGPVKLLAARGAGARAPNLEDF